ncbi:MAG: YebC/PmpR family DNA-binding transcriptional regulator [bacterium]|nr:YebC/PmpR family DNA-binding transcriptional regulator [bacterium]
MSKHSKWAKIKRKKGVADVKKGNIFTKLGHAIALAARSGTDPESNFKLRLAIDNARAHNMPKDTIERGIARGAGKIDGQIIEEVLYEAFGPAGIMLMIEAVTDNKNRTVNDLKRVLQDHGGRLGGPNSITRMFERKGLITIPKTTINADVELVLIDAGAEDIASNDEIVITAAPHTLEAVRRASIENHIEPTDVTLEWIPKEYAPIPENKKESIKEFFEALDALDDVQEWYANVNLENF